MKIVLNGCYGGFGLSDKLLNTLSEKWEDYSFQNAYENRTNPELIKAIEKLGVRASSGQYAKLKIIDIPDGIKYEIDEYDGIETVHEQHDSWS